MKVKMIASAVVCVALAFTSSADGRDGLVHWWKVKDLNGDGLVQAQEVYDVMSVGAEKPLTASEIVQDTTGSEMAEPVSVGRGVTFASMRKTVDDAMYFSLNNPTNYVDGELVANWQSITLPKETSLGCDEATVIARFRWHGCRSKKNNAGSGFQYDVALYANNYYADGARGWRVGLRCYDSGTSTMMYPTLYIGNGSSYREVGSYGAGSQFLVRKGQWCDFAVTFKRDPEGNVAALFVLRNSGSSGNRDRQHYTYTKTDKMTIVSEDKFPEPKVYSSYIGYNGMTDFSSPLSRGENTFGGDIYDIRVYDRQKDEYEILSEFVDAAPLFAVGSVNSSGDEFSDADPADVFEPASMEWAKMRKTLTSEKPSVSVKCDVAENGRDLGRLVEIKFVEGDVPARIEVLANGASFGLKRVRKDGWLRFFIPAEIMSSLQKDADSGTYPLILTFRRTDKHSRGVTIDFLRAGGAWQLGTADKSTGEFGVTGEEYYNYYYNVGQNNIKQLARSLGTQGLYAHVYLYFPVGDWAAANLPHKLTVKSNDNLAEVNDAVPFAFRLNGADSPYVEFAKDEFYNGGNSVAVPFPAGILRGGVSHLKLSVPEDVRTLNSKGESVPIWIGIDYWRFEPEWNGLNYDKLSAIILR